LSAFAPRVFADCWSLWGPLTFYEILATRWFFLSRLPPPSSLCGSWPFSPFLHFFPQWSPFSPYFFAFSITLLHSGETFSLFPHALIAPKTCRLVDYPPRLFLVCPPNNHTTLFPHSKPQFSPPPLEMAKVSFPFSSDIPELEFFFLRDAPLPVIGAGAVKHVFGVGDSFPYSLDSVSDALPSTISYSTPQRSHH